MALPRTDAQRVAAYDAKTNASTVSLKVAARLPGMRTSFTTFANDFVAKQLLVNAQLATDATIFPIWYGGYQAYAAELWKLAKTTTGVGLDAAAQIVATKWASRGLTNSMLVSIALNVFSIVVV
jgi:hypothetical protein